MRVVPPAILALISATLLALPSQAQVTFEFGANVAPRIKSRLTEFLKNAKSSTPLTISIGDTATTRKYISAQDLLAEGSEGFIVRSRTLDTGETVVVADGNSGLGERTVQATNRGVSFAAYEVLQQLGFRFLHPFTPTIPRSLTVPSTLNISEKPRWPTRGVHLHTMHPIELSHVLNGWGPNGPDDKAGFTAALSEWDLYCEWMIAHRQNEVEWVLLADKVHTSFNDSPERAQRLKQLVSMSHAWGLLTGIDVGVIFEQQNMWRLLRNQTTDAADNVEIRSRIRWLMQSGWDFVTAEMGASEFTSPSDVKMLLWMNILTDELERVYDRFAAVKIHVSQGQTTSHYSDPDTHQPLNFNFLPMFADKKLVVLPHTVELYSLDDAAPTYGNTDFKEIHRFLSMQAGVRPVVFYPESTYWVSYDIDTPLFLPSYAERRLHDLRMIAREEDAHELGRGALKGSRIQGQLLFASGFEWGYWFNNLVAMHAAWNPHNEMNERTAFEQITQEILRPDAASQATTHALGELLSDTVVSQDNLLINGKVNGKSPRQIERLTGIAYLSGQETWDELNTSLADILGIKKAPTQPNRLGFRSLRSGLDGQGVNFATDVHPLLDAMSTDFGTLSQRTIDLFKNTPNTDTNKAVLAEFADGALMNALRANQIHELYDATAAENLGESQMWRDQKIASARHMLDLANGVVARREKSFRSKFDRITEWQSNPTVYQYGYLWTAHSLFWWYRDEGNVTLQPSNACFMNIVNPAETAFAEGKDNTYYQWAQRLADLAGLGSIKECLTPPTTEPNPQARVRSYQ